MYFLQILYANHTNEHDLPQESCTAQKCDFLDNLPSLLELCYYTQEYLKRVKE